MPAEESALGVIGRPSPNHDDRGGAAVDILLLHYTGMPTAAAALDRLTDPKAKVSAHYLVDEDGTTYALVPEDRRAWHAGVASWAGATDINARSIGIELANPGHEWGYRSFPEAQMTALVSLSQAILARHPIPPHRVLAHSDVAPERKEDPGELFDWAGLARAGIGLWPGETPPADRGDVVEAQGLLARYGYDVEETGRMDARTRLAVIAFQRHFRPAAITETITGAVDPGTLATLRALVTMAGL